MWDPGHSPGEHYSSLPHLLSTHHQHWHSESLFIKKSNPVEEFVMYTINFEPFNFPSQFWAAEMLFAIHTQLRTESFLLSVQSWVHTEHCWFNSGVFWAGCFSSNFQGGSQQFLGHIKPHFQSQMSEESSKQGHIKWKNTPKCAIRNELCRVCVFQCAYASLMFDLDPVSE